MKQIFTAMNGTLSLTNLNIAFNTNEYTRYPIQSEQMFEAMAEFFDQNLKMVHLDLSGLNLGVHALTLAPALVKSTSLQSIHFHNNNITDEIKSGLYDIFRIRIGVRNTMTDI